MFVLSGLCFKGTLIWVTGGPGTAGGGGKATLASAFRSVAQDVLLPEVFRNFHDDVFKAHFGHGHVAFLVHHDDQMHVGPA